MANKKLVTYAQLNTLAKGIYDKLHKEVGTAAAGVVQNQKDIAALSGRVTIAEGAIETINGSETTEGSIAKALKDAKGYADTKDGELHTTITGEINDAKTALTAEINKKANSADMKTQLDAKANAADLTAEVNRATGAEEALAGRLNVIEGEGEGSIKKALADAKADADAKYATKGTVSGIDTRLTTAESDIDKIEVALGKDAQGNIKSIDDRISEVNTAAEELAGRVAQNETDIATIKGDYLKAADKTALEGKIAEAKEQADKGVADAAKAQSTADDAKGKIDTFLKDATINGAVVDTLKEIQEYVTSDGAAAAQMTADIASRVKQTDYDAKVQILEAADAALGNRATALETIVGKEAKDGEDASGLVKKVADNKAGIATNKTDIANLKAAVGDVGKVAAQSALEAVKGRVETVENKVSGLETAVGKPAVEGGAAATGLYKLIDEEAARAKGVETGLRTDVDALKTTVGDAGKGLVKDVADLQSAVSTLNGSSHTHDNKTTLDAITATVKEGYDNAVAKVTGDANTDGTIANAKKAGTDAQAAVNGLKLGVDLSDDTKAVVQLKTSADAVQNSIEIVYPYEFVTDAEINELIKDLGKTAQA